MVCALQAELRVMFTAVDVTVSSLITLSLPVPFYCLSSDANVEDQKSVNNRITVDAR